MSHRVPFCKSGPKVTAWRDIPDRLHIEIFQRVYAARCRLVPESQARREALFASFCASKSYNRQQAQAATDDIFPPDPEDSDA